jgi:hypothetical protein
MPIISPEGWDYVFLISTPAVMYLVNYADELPRSTRLGVTIALLVIAFSLFDLMGRRAYTAFMCWSMITACYVIVIRSRDVASAADRVAVGCAPARVPGDATARALDAD